MATGFIGSKAKWLSAIVLYVDREYWLVGSVNETFFVSYGAKRCTCDYSGSKAGYFIMESFILNNNGK